MKSVLGLCSAVILSSLSFATFADKITITGQPVVLEQRGDVYYFPKDQTVTATDTNYHFVRVGDAKKVCYVQKPVELATVDATTLRVDIGGTPTDIYCYSADDATYFTVTQ